MCQVRKRESFVVEFLLSFKGEEKSGSSEPYHAQRTFELDKSKLEGIVKSEELKSELTEVVRRYFAGLNEFPMEVVQVELINFEPSKKNDL